MSIAVRALGIAVIVMMAVLAIRLLNEREQLSRNLENRQTQSIEMENEDPRVEKKA